jgi:hypothetical protein
MDEDELLNWYLFEALDRKAPPSTTPAIPRRPSTGRQCGRCGSYCRSGWQLVAEYSERSTIGAGSRPCSILLLMAVPRLRRGCR